MNLEDVDIESEIRTELSEQISREEAAHFCLGPKGKYYDDQEWERREKLLFENPGAYLRGELA